MSCMRAPAVPRRMNTAWAASRMRCSVSESASAVAVFFCRPVGLTIVFDHLVNALYSRPVGWRKRVIPGATRDRFCSRSRDTIHECGDKFGLLRAEQRLVFLVIDR